MEIKDSNKLIAEFMGATVLETYLNPQKEVDHYLMDMGQTRLVNSRYIANTCLNYHKSYDWLMPVVDKLQSLGFVFNITGKSNYTYIGNDKLSSNCSSNNRLSNIYVVVVEILTKF